MRKKKEKPFEPSVTKKDCGFVYKPQEGITYNVKIDEAMVVDVTYSIYGYRYCGGMWVPITPVLLEMITDLVAYATTYYATKKILDDKLAWEPKIPQKPGCLIKVDKV